MKSHTVQQDLEYSERTCMVVFATLYPDTYVLYERYWALFQSELDSVYQQHKIKG